MYRDAERDRRIEIIARRQHGVLTLEQAFGAGFDQSAVHRRLASGAWIRLAPGVYAIASSVLTTYRQYKAAQLSVGGAAVCGLAAAHLHGFEGFVVVRAEITVPLGRTSRTRLATVHRWVVPPRFTAVRGIRVTSVAQTLLDLAGRVDESRLERTMDDQVLTGKVKVPALSERLAAYEGTRRQGLPLYRSLVEERTEHGYAPTESELEARMVPLIRRVAGVGRVVVQPQLPWRSRRPGRCDVLLPDVDALVEGDGRRWHARVRDFDSDRERDNEAVLHRLRPLRFTWRHVTTRQALVLDQLRRLVDLRAA